MPARKRKVIVVTDGDLVAGRTVQVAANNIGARFISLTTGNPTPVLGPEIVELIKMTPYDPVVILVDDRGKQGLGQGEQALKYIAQHPDIEIIGAVAVASNTTHATGIKVDKSVTRDGNVIKGPVSKNGTPEEKGHKYLEGDTVEVIRQLDIPVVIGTGDTGKMDFADDLAKGAPITTRALLEIINRSEKSDRNHEIHS